MSRPYKYSICNILALPSIFFVQGIELAVGRKLFDGLGQSMYLGG